MKKIILFAMLVFSAGILFSQNVGIGIPTPTEKLHILGASNADVMVKTEAVGTQGSAAFTAKGTGGLFDVFQMTKYNPSAAGSVAGIPLANLSFLYSGANAGPMLLDVISNNIMQFATNNTIRLTIDQTGNVGIGTTTPTLSKLQVEGTSNHFTGASSSTVPGVALFSPTDYPTLGLNMRNNYIFMGNGYGSMFQYSPVTGFMTYWQSTVAGVAGATNGVWRQPFTIDNNGNVGVGTNAPATTLHVKSTSSNPVIFDGGASSYFSIVESGVYRGYWGSYAGNPEDVDFGTGGGNATGKLHLTIQGTPKVTVDNNGNLGVGTTSPNYKVHVTGGDLFIQSSSGSLKIGYNGSNQWQFPTTNGGADLMMHSSTDGSTFTPRHYFAQNGNVGIGTGASTPTTRLQVSTTASEVIRMNGAAPYLSFYDNTDGYKGYLWYNGTDMVLGSSSAAIRFGSAGYRMTINTDGRVSIGSSNNPATGYLLSVDGKAICNELKVQLTASWPDYVFDEKYSLLPIDELEKSIQSNKHLPNIPSAADITADKGFEVGDMNRKLLEKVEELTLYIIQINKDKKQLEERLSVVEKKQAEKVNQ